MLYDDINFRIVVERVLVGFQEIKQKCIWDSFMSFGIKTRHWFDVWFSRLLERSSKFEYFPWNSEIKEPGVLIKVTSRVFEFERSSRSSLHVLVLFGFDSENLDSLLLDMSLDSTIFKSYVRVWVLWITRRILIQDRFDLPW